MGAARSAPELRGLMGFADGLARNGRRPCGYVPARGRKRFRHRDADLAPGEAQTYPQGVDRDSQRSGNNCRLMLCCSTTRSVVHQSSFFSLPAQSPGRMGPEGGTSLRLCAGAREEKISTQGRRPGARGGTDVPPGGRQGLTEIRKQLSPNAVLFHYEISCAPVFFLFPAWPVPRPHGLRGGE